MGQFMNLLMVSVWLFTSILPKYSAHAGYKWPRGYSPNGNTFRRCEKYF